MVFSKVANKQNVDNNAIYHDNSLCNASGATHYDNDLPIEELDEECPACSILLDAAGALVEFWRDKHIK